MGGQEFVKRKEGKEGNTICYEIIVDRKRERKREKERKR